MHRTITQPGTQPGRTGALRLAIMAVSMAGLFGLAACDRGMEQAAEPSHPDLSGFWNWAPTDPHSEIATEMLGDLPEDMVLLEDTGPVEYGPGVFGGLEVKPAALEKAQQWTPQEELKPENTCRRPSIVYAMQGPFPMAIHQSETLIILQMEYFDMVRIVFMDGRDHPPADAPHSTTGHSVGHWEGDTLVVDTTHLEAATITNNGLDHSDSVHVVERFRLGEDGQMLYATQSFEDPDVLNNRGIRFMGWRRQPGGYIYPYECDPFAYME